MDPQGVLPPKPPRYNISQQKPVLGTTTVLEQSHIQFRSYSQSKKPNYEDDLSFSSYVKPKENDEPEISIFDAQKYFCEGNHSNGDDVTGLSSSSFMKIQQSRDVSGPRLSSVSSEGYGRNLRTRSFHATPTASSEASWNSQTGLLVNPPGSMAVSMKNFGSDDSGSNLQRRRSGKKWIFGRKCCCTGKKSVWVKEAVAATVSGQVEGKNGPRAMSDSHKGSDHHRVVDGRHQKIPTASARVLSSPEIDFVADLPRQQRISASGRPFVDGAGGFSFPILKNPTQTVRPGPRGIRPLEEDPPRESLEVFQPPENNPAASASGGGCRIHFNPGSPIARVVSTDDDLGSDASSDLFELESFSTQTTTCPMYRRRDSLDEAPIFNARRFTSAGAVVGQYDRRSLDEPPTPSVAATECYPPSEVSIDWSVTTAEGFDRASVSNFSVSASDPGGAAFLRQMAAREDTCGGRDDVRRKGSTGGLLLMSCRQGKAVSVGPQPHLPPGAVQVTEVGGAPAGGRPPRGNKTSAAAMGNDHSGRRSLAFAA